MPLHKDTPWTERHDDKRLKAPVRAASTANVPTTSPGAAVDGVSLVPGNRILLKNQTSAAENGIYVWAGPTTALTRAADAAVASDFTAMFQVGVTEGVVNDHTYWVFSTIGALTLNTTALAFTQLGGGGGTVTSVALAMPAEWVVTGSPVTGSGTITVTEATENANTQYSGPASGAAATPGFRALVPADLPVMHASGSTHTAGAAPDPGATAGTTRFLREDAAWTAPPSTSVMGASGSSHAAGAAPDPGATAGTTRFLREDAAWSAPPSTSVMGASGGSHAAGAAPDPGSTSGTTRFLREDASWAVPAGTGGGGGTSGTPYHEEFAPSAAATTVTLANTPSTVLSVFRNGVAQSVADSAYSVAGSVITFTTAFLTGERVVVSYIGPGAGGGGGSAGGAGSGALVPIQVIGPLSAAQATLLFSGIPATGFRNLRLVLSARSTAASTNVSGLLQINGDSGANYDYLFNSSGTVANLAAQNSIVFARVAGSTAPASTFSSSRIEFPDYANTAKNRDLLWVSSVKVGATSTSMGYDPGAAWWRNSAAASSITLSLSSGNFDVGTYACLYGEMDTAGVLLTPASNLISETVLSAAAASISIPTIPQGYKDLRVVLVGRTDATGTEVVVNLLFNGDSGANYDIERMSASSTSVAGADTNAATSLNLGNLPAISSTANAVSSINALIPDYAGTTWHKTVQALNSHVLAEASTQRRATFHAGFWRSSAAITSIQLTLASGNFIAGTVVRVYGEPVASGGASVGTGTRLRISSNQSVATATPTAIAWDTEDNDADNQHFTSAAALTGTVAKTAAGNVLTGTSTLFTTELSVGQVISVPGTVTEPVVVIGITSDTSLIIAGRWNASASGQTATRLNTPVVFRQSGFYFLETTMYSAALASGGATLQFRLTSPGGGTTIIDQKDQAGVNAAAGYELVTQRQFQQWDYVEVLWTQTSGGSVNVTADERTHFSISARPTVIVAVPYINIQDQKASGTEGGTFTAGAWQTRTLNTIASDTAGVAALASNQVTLPPGTYRCNVRAQARGVNSNALRLRNITATTTLLNGDSCRAESVTATALMSGKFVLSGQTVLEVQHICETTAATNGLGISAGSRVTGGVGAEVYTVAEFFKEG